MDDLFNIAGLIFMLVLLIPNAVYVIINRGRPVKKEKHKILEPIEQVARVGCIAFMTLNVPGTYFGFWSETAFAVYLSVDFALTFTYCLLWIVFWRSNTLPKALTLSIIPSVMLLFSGVISRSILLTIFALIFAPAHILISCMDAKIVAKDEENLVMNQKRR